MSDLIQPEVKVEEVKVEAVKAEEVHMIDASNSLLEKTIIALINEQLMSEKALKVEINMNAKTVELVKKLLNLNTNVVTDIECSIIEIMRDGKINSKDIPQLIVLVQRLYQTFYEMKDRTVNSKTLTIITATILKFIVQILVLNNNIKINDDKQVEFLTECNLLIDSCVGLLNFPKSIKPKGCLKQLFG